MEEKQIMSSPNPSLEDDGEGNFFPSSGFEEGSEHKGSGQVTKHVHRFYFVKLSPSLPESISKIKNEESVLEKMNQDLCEITQRINEKTSEKNHLDSKLERLYYQRREWRSSLARKGKTLNHFYMALDELSFANRRSNETCFTRDFDNHKLNSLIHGSKSLAEENRILRDRNIQQRDVASFKSLEVLKDTIRWNYYIDNWQMLHGEIEQFQTQYLETASDNASKKGNISSYNSLKKSLKEQIKSLKEQIKHYHDDSMENRSKVIALGTRIRRSEKELKAINQDIYSLRTKMTEKNQKKGETYQSIFKLKILYDKEIKSYYQYCSLIDKVHELAEEKDVVALDELSHSEVGKFMLEWNSNKAFREDYEKKVQQSLEARTKQRWTKEG